MERDGIPAAYWSSGSNEAPHLENNNINEKKKK